MISPPNSSFLRLARLIALAFMSACLVAFVAGVFTYGGYAASHPGDFLMWDWTLEEMEAIFGRIGLTFQWWIQWDLISAIGFAVLISGIGFLIFIRKRDDWFSLYVAVAFVLFGTFSGSPVSTLGGTYPTLEPVITLLGVSAWLVLWLIFYMFPDGQLVPRWTRWVIAVLILGYAVDLIIYGGATPPAPLALIMVLGFAIAPISQVYRYRKVSNAVQRQQTKWVAFAMLVVFIFVLIGFGGLFFPLLTDPGSSMAPVFAITGSTASLVMGLIPLSIAFAIMRYHLWDVDVLIRRTLQYALLTGLLALVFFGGVTVLQQAFGSLTGTADSPIAVVLTTLLIAALFNPLRWRVQDFIDRRFFRKKYDAEQALARFAATARDETDIEQLRSELLAVVQETMQPEKVGLWLQETKRDI